MITRVRLTTHMYDDPFDILEVPATASADEIHAAFRKKARQHHPDMGGDRQKFQELTEAYEELLRRKTSESKVLPEVTTPLKKRPVPRNPFAPPATAPQKKTARKSSAGGKRTGKPASSAKHLLTGKLPLQDQTTYFILVNTLDIFLTYLHLISGNHEANPIAAMFIQSWGVIGMIAYKMSIVALVCVIAQIVALTSLKKAAWLLNFGTLFTTCVVIYSVWLLAG